MRFSRLFPPFLLAAAILPQLAYAQTGADDVRGALGSLETWLSSSDRGAGWHSFLKTDVLKAELDKGGAADKAIVEDIFNLYSSKQGGLGHPQFSEVRKALEAWLAELNLPAGDQLGELATTAAEKLKPLDPEKLTQAKQKLEAVIKQTDSFLKRGGQEREAGWKDFFRWEKLNEELAAQKPGLDVFTQVWAGLASEQPGVDHPRFMELREALRNYIDLQEALGDETSALATLPEKLKAFQEAPSEQTTAALGLALGWMDRTKQDGDLIRAIRHHYAKPNLFVEQSDRLVLFGMDQPVDNRERVSDYQEGTSISGNSHTLGEIQSKLVPNHKRGEINLHMTGKMDAKTVGYNNNGVTIHTTGKTTIEANKPIYFTETGLQAGQAIARCRTRNVVNSISATSSQVESIARQRIAENHSSNEQRSARRAEDQVERQLNDRAAKQIADGNKRMQEDYFAPLARRSVKPRLNKYRSTDKQVLQTSILAAPEHLAAPNDPPAATGEGDMNARVHVSYLNNYGDILMRGSVLTDEGLAQTLEEWRGEVPEELKVTEDSDPWNIVFASRRPLIVEVGDDTISFTLRGKRFTARNNTSNEAMNIFAKYKIERDGESTKLVRDGDVEITFPDQDDKLSPKLIASKSFWETKFSALFAPEFKDLNLRLRDNWEKAGPLQLQNLTSRKDGWIVAAWNMPPEAADTETKEESKNAAKKEEPTQVRRRASF